MSTPPSNVLGAFASGDLQKGDQPRRTTGLASYKPPGSPTGTALPLGSTSGDGGGTSEGDLSDAEDDDGRARSGLGGGIASLGDIDAARRDRATGKGTSRTAAAATAAQRGAEAAAVASRFTSSVLTKYTTRKVVISHADTTHGIMPGINDTVVAIAVRCGVDLEDSDQFSAFIDALVTDIYQNAYSDKRVWTRDITVPGFTLNVIHVYNEIFPIVGTHFRRFARAMAPVIVEVITSNMPAYMELLNARAHIRGISLEEAIYAFDGADMLVTGNRAAAAKGAMAKQLAINAAYNSGNDHNSVSTSGASQVRLGDYRRQADSL